MNPLETSLKIRQSASVSGKVINLTRVLKILSRFDFLQAMGSNSTVSYLSPYYPGISSLKTSQVPIMQMSGNDFLLFEFTLDNEWLNNHNLFVFTPYFYSYNNIIIFGSNDSSLFFSKYCLSSDNKIRVCCTASKEIADEYSKLGYFISKIPIDYNLNSQYNVLIRIGDIGDSGNVTDINQFVKTTFNTTANTNLTYFTSQEIIASYPKVYSAISDEKIEKIITSYNEIKSYLNSIETLIFNKVYPYFSSYASPPVDFAVQSFYDSINLQNLNPSRNPLDILANNTCENYFMSNPINVTNTVNINMYILYINQYDAGASCTSNIQFYDIENTSEIFTIYSAPDLPSMNDPNYPIPKKDDLKNFPPYGLYVVPFKELKLQSDTIVVTERISYGLINANHIEYNTIVPMCIYIGGELTIEQYEYLKTNYKSLKISVYKPEI